MLKTTIANIENKIKRNASIQDKDKIAEASFQSAR
jgi:hypothetical protein